VKFRIRLLCKPSGAIPEVRRATAIRNPDQRVRTKEIDSVISQPKGVGCITVIVLEDNGPSNEAAS